MRVNVSTGRQPAYNFVGGTFALWSAGDAWQQGGQNLYRHKDAVYFLASENEWYKAAYYDPHKTGGPGYWDYPTGSDTAPTAVTGGTSAGTAVFNQAIATGPADVTSAGGLSPYGTMGQGGNAHDWLESAYDGVNNSPTESRGVRGGNWSYSAMHMMSLTPNSSTPSAEYYFVGFRVAAVPEPVGSACAVSIACLGLFLLRQGSGPHRSRC
jgi:formylglycine-generating enzyme required for sulfatase activity